MPNGRDRLPAEETDWFLTTHWTLIQKAGLDASVSTAASVAALQALCSQYWQPLYFYVRRKGFDGHAAEDLTQEFFARLLARNDLAGLDPSRGPFRAFLLASMNHFLANEWRRANTLKRGAGQATLHLDTVLAESQYASHPHDATPERSFDRRWAETILEQAATSLREEFLANGRGEVFQALNRFLSAPGAARDYETAGASLQLSTAAVAKTVERLRRRFRELVRHEIAQTVRTPAELDDEMRYLLEILRHDPSETGAGS